MLLVKSMRYSEAFQGSGRKFPSPQNQKKSDSNQKSNKSLKPASSGQKIAENAHLEQKTALSGTKLTSIRSRTVSMICSSRRSSSATKASPRAKADANHAMNTISEKWGKQPDLTPKEANRRNVAQSKFHAFLARIGLHALKENNGAYQK